MRVAVSGANGFVGQALAQHLASSGHQVLAYMQRSGVFAKTAGIIAAAAPDLCLRADWQLSSGQEIDVFVHCAARVHVMSDESTDSLNEFRRVNVDGTASLARQAAAAGVRRFIFLSSIKVNGEYTEAEHPFRADDPPAPESPYGVSKHEAEQVLRHIAADTGMEVVIIRPPLVYGPGVKANFESMMRLLVRGFPMPLAAVNDNLRSLVALDNLVDLIVTCMDHTEAINQTLLVSDGEDLSTANLLRRMGTALDHPARLFYVPRPLLSLSAKIANSPEIYKRLCSSLQLDITKTRDLLGWAPRVSVYEGLRRAANGFRS